MIVPILALIAVLALTAGVVLSSALVAAQTSLRNVAVRVADLAVGDGVVHLTSALATREAAAVAAAADGTEAAAVSTEPVVAEASSPVPGCRGAAIPGSADAAPECRLLVSASARLIATTTASPQRGDARCAGDDACGLQIAERIDEQRVAAIVTASVTTESGALLAVRSRLVTVRVLAAAPYAVVVGSADLADGVADAGPGDSGGRSGGDASAGERDAGARDAANAPSDTRVHLALRYERVPPSAGTGPNAPNDGLEWGVQNKTGAIELPPPALPPGASQGGALDRFATRAWRNGGENASGWER